MLNAYFGLMEDDPVVARAFQIEIDALGVPARRRRRIALRRIAEFISFAQRQMMDEEGRTVLHRPLSAYVGVVYACRQIAIDTLEQEPEQPPLRALVPELASWAAASLRVV